MTPVTEPAAAQALLLCCEILGHSTVPTSEVTKTESKIQVTGLQTGSRILGHGTGAPSSCWLSELPQFHVHTQVGATFRWMINNPPKSREAQGCVCLTYPPQPGLRMLVDSATQRADVSLASLVWGPCPKRRVFKHFLARTCDLPGFLMESLMLRWPPSLCHSSSPGLQID